LAGQRVLEADEHAVCTAWYLQSYESLGAAQLDINSLSVHVRVPAREVEGVKAQLEGLRCPDAETVMTRSMFDNGDFGARRHRGPVDLVN
jgi:hypothetical protein